LQDKDLESVETFLFQYQVLSNLGSDNQVIKFLCGCRWYTDPSHADVGYQWLLRFGLGFLPTYLTSGIILTRYPFPLVHGFQRYLTFLAVVFAHESLPYSGMPNPLTHEGRDKDARIWLFSIRLKPLILTSVQGYFCKPSV